MTEKPSASRPIASSGDATAYGVSPSAAMTGMTASQIRDPIPTATSSSGPEYVEMEGGYLIHRVKIYSWNVRGYTINLNNHLATDRTR